MKKYLSVILSIAAVLCVLSAAYTAFSQEIEITDEFGEYSYSVTTSDKAPELKASKVNENVIKLEWEHYDWSADVSGFEVLKYSKSKKAFLHLAYTEKSCYNVKNLKPSSAYSFKVRSYSEDNEGNKYFGAESEALNAATSPKPVKIKSAKYVSTGKIEVKWKKSKSGSGYLIQYSTSQKFSSRYTNTVTVSGKSKTSKKIGALGKKTYYVRICPYKKADDKLYLGEWSDVASVKVKKGVSLKTMINSYKTDMSGRKYIKQLTDNGVDIKKYKTTYDRFKAIYEWHAVHGLEFEHCLACNSNFNSCIDALFGESRKYDSFIWIAAGEFKNSNGSVSIHKWSVLYFSGVEYIFDPRLQSYTKDYKGTLYFGIPKNSSLKKKYLFDCWYGAWRYQHYDYEIGVIPYKK